MSEVVGESDGLVRPMDWRAILLGVLALIGTAVLVGLVNLQVSTERERDEALTKQAQTYEVIIHAGLLSTAVAESEASLARYIVSADKKLGQQYSDLWSGA